MLRTIVMEILAPTILLFLIVILSIGRQYLVDYFGLSIQLPFTLVAYSVYLVPSMQLEIEGPIF